MIQQDISHFITYLKSAYTSQKFLEDCYIKNKIEDASKWSYENSYRFLYYLEHGLQLYKTGDQSSIIVKPIMYFYGMVHLIKACLLTCKPNYPENTSMLAHGVSTRKRKKQQYAFLQDEVKVQHKGLFPYFSNYLFHVEQISFEKINMDKLLASIPELNDLFFYHRGKSSLVQIGPLNSKRISFPNYLLDSYHTTESSFIAKISKYLPTIENSYFRDGKINIDLKKPLTLATKGPFYLHKEEGEFYFPCKRDNFSISHEIMSHYLLLYNLSMICRYETEWWGELLHTQPTEDYPFIDHFLSVTTTKVPFLLGYYLLNKKKTNSFN